MCLSEVVQSEKNKLLYRRMEKEENKQNISTEKPNFEKLAELAVKIERLTEEEKKGQVQYDSELETTT